MNQEATPGQETVVIQIDWSDEPCPAYANGATVLNSHREFALMFTDFVPCAGRGNVELNEMPKAKLVGNIRMTPDVFFQFVASCATNWNKYVNQYGQAGATTPKFKLVGGGKVQLEGLEPPQR